LTRFVWIDGRFSWPFVVFVLYGSICVLVADYAWRVLVLPFDTLLLGSIVVSAAGALLLAVMVFTTRRKAGRQRS